MKDRNDVVLVNKKLSYRLIITPEKSKDIKKEINKLRKIIHISSTNLNSLNKKIKKSKKFKGITIKKNLSLKEIAIFSASRHNFDSISIKKEKKRNYIYKDILAHAIGYVGKINKNELQNIKKQNMDLLYKGSKTIGKKGIEKSYEIALRGRPGIEKREINSQGRVVKTEIITKTVEGKDINLTIDIKLQSKIYEIMENKKGAVVAINPNNGEILAMISKPSYDPNMLFEGNSDSIKKILFSKESPLINRATQGSYPPASTIKPHIALIGLEQKKIQKESKIKDPGWWKMPNVTRKWRDWKKNGHGIVDTEHAIAGSCDVFFYELAYKLGITKIYNFMHQMGFGEKTGIDIEEESKGNMPSKEWKRSQLNESWYTGDTISVGIGQGYWSATPIQLVKSIAIIANKGKIINPHLVIKEETEQEQKPEYVDIVDLKNWEYIARSMYLAGHSKTGTAYKIFKNSEYKVAVKSGTSQLFNVAEDEEYEADKVSDHLKDHALFVGWAPYKNPKIAIAIVLENGGWGGSNAGPIAKKIFDEYLLKNHEDKKQSNKI